MQATCNHCGKVGHLQSVCLSREKEQKAGKPSGKPHCAPFMQKVHQTRQEQASDDNDDIPDATDSSLFHLTGNTQVQPFEVTVMVDSKPLRMEIYTGTTSSLVTEIPSRSCG